MISQLRGKIISIDYDSGIAVIDVQDVGYRLFCDQRSLEIFARGDDMQTVQIETHVREDHIHLYGFHSALARQWFRTLLGVQGVGAKVALAILSCTNGEQLQIGIAAGDKALIGRANGVGPKLAARIISELQSKVGGFAQMGASGALASGDSSVINDAVQALESLGMDRSKAYQCCAKLHNDANGALDVSELIRRALQQM